MRNEQTTRVYSVYAPIYDRVFGAVFRDGRIAAISKLDPQPGTRILEVGVGTGLMLPLYPAHCSVVGIDLSAGMLAKASARVERQGLTNVELRHMDAAAMGFPDASFDAVLAAYVVTAAPDHRALLDEMIRVCRPGGRILLMNHFSNGNRVLGTLERVFSPLFERAGFRTDLSLPDVIDGTGLQVRSNRKVNPLGLWRLVECVKPGLRRNG